MKKTVKILLTVLAAVLVTAALGLLTKDTGAGLEVSEKYPLLSHSILVTKPGERVRTLLVRQDGKELARLEGCWSSDVQYSLDHSQAAFHGIREDPQSGNALPTLYLVDNGRLLPIADNASHFCLALEGGSLLYLRREDNSLRLYRSGETSLIAKDLGPGIQGLRLSPDGTAAAWNYEDSAYFYNGETVTFLGEGVWCDSISAQGELLYLTDSRWEHQLFVQRGEENSTRKALGTGFFTWFNRDLTQLIYHTGEGEDSLRYLLLDGCTQIPLGPEYFCPILPLGTQAEHSVIGVDTFADCCFSTGDFDVGICRFDREFNLFRLLETGKADSVSLCPDGRTLVYRSNDDHGLYRLDAVSQETDVLLAESVRNWEVTDNGESCYYEDQQERLFYREGGKSPVLLAEKYDRLVPGILCDTALYTVAAPHEYGVAPTAYDVYAVRKGRSRRILRVSSDYIRWRDAVVGATQRNGTVLCTQDQSGEIRCYFFDEPWKFDKLRPGRR